MKKEYKVTVCQLPAEDIKKWNELAVPVWEKIAKKSPMCREWVELQKNWMKWRGYL